jgi:ABC-type branched-subunit amino acid transport system ATPase component
MENLEMGSTEGSQSLAAGNHGLCSPSVLETKKQSGGTLSGGEQMLAIGRGLMTKPKLLIPTSRRSGWLLRGDEIFSVIDKIKEGRFLVE